MAASHGGYYLPNPSPWPIITSVGLFGLGLGAALTVNHLAAGPWVLAFGAAMIVYILFRWFGTVIGESEGGLYGKQVDLTFRLAMGWFIFSEVMFFAAFFGALFYIRVFSMPWIAADELLWPGFEAIWPETGMGPKGSPFAPMETWGIPAINTLILLTSGATVTWAHWGLLKNNRSQLILGLFLTVALGVTFLTLQVVEYGHAYHELGLTMKSGVYGATFFMLTGFHGMHVTLGTIMLIVILLRSIKGHFKPDHHFGFEGVAWYWHFVDVVWLGLFIFVYWL